MIYNQECIMSSISELVEYEVMSWPNVEKRPHRFGGIEFRVNGHEIGHLHGNRLADLPFSVPVREELVAAGRASLHHIFPQTGWVSYYIQGPESVPGLIELFRLNYERYSRSVVSPQAKQE
jgi:Luciferase